MWVPRLADVRFEYNAVDAEGTRHAGTVEASGLEAAAIELRSHDWSIHTLRAVDAASSRRIEGTEAFAFFNEGLAALARAGMPLSMAVGELARGLGRGAMRESLGRVQAALEQGQPLDGALEGGGFPAAYRGFVRAGLAAGNLPAVLSAVAVHARAVARMRRGIARALVYPAVTLAAGLAICVAMLSLTAPLFEAGWVHMSEPPPASTGAGWVVALAAGYVAAAAGLVVMGWRARRAPGGERLLWRLPLLGELLRGLCQERFYGSLQILVDAGAPLAEAVPAAATASGSAQMAAEAERIRRGLGEAAPLDAELLRPLVPGAAAARLADAERTGRLGEALARLRERAADDADWRCDALLAALETAAVVSVGALLAAAALTTLWPYLQLLERFL
jgi:type II secretory pathway component PulF